MVTVAICFFSSKLSSCFEFTVFDEKMPKKRKF